MGARDLRECLMLQLDPDMPMYDEVKTLISGHLEDLRDNRLPAIQRKTGLLDEPNPRRLGSAPETQPQAGGRFHGDDRTDGHAGRLP